MQFCLFCRNIHYSLLLIKRYNLFKVLPCSTTFFHLSLFCATFFQLRTFMLFISSKTSSYQRILGLPIGLLDMSFHLLIFCTLSSAMRSTWPNQFSLCFLINPIIFCPFNMSLISWLVLILQYPSKFYISTYNNSAYAVVNLHLTVFSYSLILYFKKI